METVEQTLAERIAEARAERGLTQSQLASAVGLERSALAKIETGQRKISALELVAVSRELGRRVEWFVQPYPPSIASYRQSAQTRRSQALDTHLDHIARDVEFVLAYGPDLMANVPTPAPHPQTMAEAEDLASTAREMLRLGADQPAIELDARVADLGLLAFAIRGGDGPDGGMVLLSAGAVAVINGDLHLGRRRLTLAHELGHYLVQDHYTMDWRVAINEAEIVEARMDRFARALLMPQQDVQARWADWTGAQSLRDASVLAGSHYRVDMATMARRLLDFDLVSGAEASVIREVRTRKADIIEKNLFVPHEMEAVSLPVRYQKAVLNLYRREKVSADRALDLLLETFDLSSLPELPARPENEIWAWTS